MPVLKKSDYESWNLKVRAIIKKGMEQEDFSDPQMAKALGIAISTWYKRKAEPALFTSYQIYQIKRALKLTSVDIMDMYRCEYKLQLA